MAKNPIRTSKLVVNPKDVTIDEQGNVVIKDPALAEAIKASQGQTRGVFLGDICCDGCGCS